MSYKYRIEDDNFSLVAQSSFTFNDIADAITAAKDYLVTIRMWGTYEITIVDDVDPTRIAASTTMSPEDLDNWALEKINKANAPKLIKIADEALFDVQTSQWKYENGMLTPKEFAIECKNTWVRAIADMELLG